MTQPLVSIIINNYNYGEFLPAAIDSALAQTYPHVEVIVVDDGSTDNSRDVIAEYGEHIDAVGKANGGQASAMNAGFTRSSGEIVQFLDADDLLAPDAVARVVNAFRVHPEAARVQARLTMIDADGKLLGTTIPAGHAVMPTGDLRERVAYYRDHTRPPTSGLVFRRSALEQVMPVPEDIYRISADQYLALATALVGPIVSLEESIGCYRVHQHNAYAVNSFGLAALRRDLEIARAEHGHLRRLARQRGINGYPERFADLADIVLVNSRMVSRKLDPDGHPVAGDRLPALARQGVALAWRYPEKPLHWRLFQTTWFAAMLVVPRRAARGLAERLFVPQKRGLFGEVMARLRSYHLLGGRRTGTTASTDSAAWPVAGERMTNPLVSIVIDNYNYARFLAAAIDSALAQTYANLEVIVVDDGSTDDSRAVIEAYGTRVRAVYKDNGGMASAFNAGYRASRGEIVQFLDSDDTLEPDAVARAVAMFEQHPGTACVQFRLAVVDEEGCPTGEARPPRFSHMPSGDLRRHVLRYRDYVRSPTSGLVYARWALEHVMPVPEDIYRMNAEQYLTFAVALVGPIVSDQEIGGCYRIHGTNAYASASLDLAKHRRDLNIASAEHEHIRQLVASLGIGGYPERFADVEGKALIAGRMISCKLDPARHPIPGDRVRDLARRGISLAFRYPGSPPHWRLAHAAWYGAMLVAPRRVAWELSERLLIPSRRGRLGAALARRRAQRSG